MRALLVVGGEAPPLERLLRLEAPFDFLCAADSGLERLESWGLEPRIIVGDMDSLGDRAALGRHPAARVLVLSRDKDDSDTEAGLRLCREEGADEVVIAGGGGGRLDHLLAIRALFERRLRPAAWHLGGDSLYLVEEGRSLAFEAAAGSLVSVFPLAGGASGMGSEGLRWPLGGLSWGPGEQSLSNEALGGPVLVRAGRGDLLLIRHWEG